MNKLKEIRERVIDCKFSLNGNIMISRGEIKRIQQASYQLGRDETIKYFIKWFDAHKNSMLITAYEDYKFILTQLITQF